MKKLFKKREYNIWQSFLIIFILSVILLVFQAVMQNGHDFEAYWSHLRHPIVLIGNFVPIFVFISILFLLTGNIAWGYVPFTLVLNIFLIINHYKVQLRDVPFKPSDLILGKEAFSIIQNYTLGFNWRIAVCTVAVWLVGTFVICCVRSKKIKPIKRISAAIALIAAFSLMYKFFYKNENIYNIANDEAYEYYEVRGWNYKGFIYCFIANSSISSYNYVMPDGYSDEAAEEILSEYEEPDLEGKKMPNVIAVMSEAYFDIEQADKAEFYYSPNPNFNALKEESEYGHLVVPGFAGDTASTEFEFLTGASTYLISRDKPSIYKTCITKDVYGLPRMFKNLGYETLAIHPGHRWFYNRHIVYPYMGFDEFINEEDLDEDVEKVNYYVSDKVTSDLIIENYKKHLEENPQQGYFNFTVTIQNHGPYSDQDSDRSPIYVRPDGMDDSLYNIINNYALGHYDADALIGDVTDFLRTVDEPTVFVFFGDHLPYLDEEYKAYDYLGYDIRSEDGDLEPYHNRYLTPYLIWSNDAAKALISESGGEVTVGDQGDISSNFLPVKLLNYMNVQLPPYFAFVESVMEITEVIGSDYFMADGKLYYTVPDDIYREYMKYRIVQYYNLMRYKGD